MNSIPRTFQIGFVVPEHLLGTIVSLLTQEVGRLHIEEVTPEHPTFSPPPPPPPALVEALTLTKPIPHRNSPRSAPHHIGVKRLANILLEVMDDGDEHDIKELGAVLAGLGYQAASASPSMTQLVAVGVLERTRKGVYRLAKTEPELELELAQGGSDGCDL